MQINKPVISKTHTLIYHVASAPQIHLKRTVPRKLQRCLPLFSPKMQGLSHTSFYKCISFYNYSFTNLFILRIYTYWIEHYTVALTLLYIIHWPIQSLRSFPSTISLAMKSTHQQLFLHFSSPPTTIDGVNLPTAAKRHKLELYSSQCWTSVQ